MSNLSAIGFDLLVCAAALALAAVLLRSEGRKGWREWWAGPWAPLAEFTSSGGYCALAARVLIGVGLLLYVLGTH
ncbi:MAG: hypothetical protein ACREOQ_06200 [Gemmatimonadales bacterium]